jgi:hypothetical protein
MNGQSIQKSQQSEDPGHDLVKGCGRDLWEPIR